MSIKDRKRIHVDRRDEELGDGVDNKAFEEDIPTFPNGRLSIVSKKSSIDGDEVVDRASWDSPIEFLLSCISMSVGLGNIWRFPYTAYSNGGGAFVIPYLIVLVFIGRPIYFLEMALGQFASFGSVKIWSCVPFFKGIGYIGMMAAIITLSYYCSIIATTIYYFVVSFQAELPWSKCLPEWVNCTNDNDAPKFYYEQVVTEQIFSIDDGIGMPLWHLTLCLAGAWVFIFFSLIKGVQSSGKVAYFTALFPYVVLFIFLIRGLTLEGSMEGVRYFIEPQWDKIYAPEVWYAAVGQCFFSLGTGTGPITMFSSYNPFRHPAYRDALIISLMDTFTSLLAGFTIFSVLGHLAFVTNAEVSDVAGAGPGLIFVSYPSAISKFTFAPQFFSVLFFLMLFTLGIGSANALAGAPITILSDQFPKVKKWQMTLGCCILGFLSGLIYCTPGGQFMTTFIDYYGATFLLYLLCMVEVVAIAWVYGLHKFIRDIEFMLGIKVGLYWIACWGFVIPVGLGAVLVYTFATAKTLAHESVGGDVLLFPSYIHIIGWGIAVFAVTMLPLWGLHSVSKTDGSSFSERLKGSFAPNKKWGPRATKTRKGWNLFKTLGEISYLIPVSDTADIKMRLRGVKDRLVLTPESNSVTVHVNNLNLDVEVEHSPATTGLLGYWHSFLGVTSHTWVIKEKSFETFRISAQSKVGIMQEPHASKVHNDYVIIIKFSDK